MPEWTAPPEFSAEAAAEATLAFGWALLADRPEHCGHGGWTYQGGHFTCECGAGLFEAVPVTGARP